MRIGKITLDGYYNYGNLLQNYALQEILLQYATVVDTIWHTENNFLPEVFWKWTWKEPVKFLINWKNFKSYFLTGHIGLEMVRQGKLREWADRYINIRKGIEDLKVIADEYDYFVTGSDQVWNPNLNDSIYLRDNFLMFAPQKKRISYAASISAPDIPLGKLEFYKNGLRGMYSLSLREESGAILVKQISGREAEVHVDPTMLLSSEKWDKVSRRPAWYHGEKYILTYFLGPRPDNSIQTIAKQNGLSIINLLDDSVYEHYVTGVDEFLWVIKHADLVCTDSFHGTVFSILYQTPFIVFDREGGEVEKKMTSRIDTLLKIFGLENRRFVQGNILENVDFKYFNDINWESTLDVLKKERKRSNSYFRDSFKNVD